MISDWPSTLPICSVTIRATTSLGPPAGNGTTTVMGRDGKVSASASSGAPPKPSAATHSRLFKPIEGCISIPSFTYATYVHLVVVSFVDTQVMELLPDALALLRLTRFRRRAGSPFRRKTL